MPHELSVRKNWGVTPVFFGMHFGVLLLATPVDEIHEFTIRLDRPAGLRYLWLFELGRVYFKRITLSADNSSPIQEISATLRACLSALPSKRLGGAGKII